MLLPFGKLLKMNKIDFNAVLYTMNLLNGKWKIPILISLKINGEQRFSELQTSVEGIGSKMLSKELKELQESGFLEKYVDTSGPIKISYKLSRYGDTLKPIFEAFSNWGALHKPSEDVNHSKLTHSHIIDI